MCDFCFEFSSKESKTTRIVYDREGVVVVPTIGCFVDGYLLVLPKQHVMSIAQLPMSQREAVLSCGEMLRERLRPVYGHYILAEHGGASACDRGAVCVDHAHLHLVPVRSEKVDELRDKFLGAGGRRFARGGQEVFEGLDCDSYVMLSIAPHCYEIWLAGSSFKRQFIRAACAEVHGVEEYYNWRQYPFIERLRRTQRLCDVVLSRPEENTAA